jgi:hypothetical protein
MGWLRTMYVIWQGVIWEHNMKCMQARIQLCEANALRHSYITFAVTSLSCDKHCPIKVTLGCPLSTHAVFLWCLHAPPCLNNWVVPNYRPTASTFQSFPFLPNTQPIPSTSYCPSKKVVRLWYWPQVFLGYLLSLLNGPLEYGGLVGHTENTKTKQQQKIKYASMFVIKHWIVWLLLRMMGALTD